MALDMSGQKITVKKSTIPHLVARLDFSTYQTVEIGDVAGYCYVSLLSANQTKKQKTKETYGEGVLQMTAEMFRKRNNDLP